MMNKRLVFILLFTSMAGFAAVCPGPEQLTPLLGPWQDIPFSDKPQDYSKLKWVRAQILDHRAGVSCTYRNNEHENYVIWWNSPSIKPIQPPLWYNDRQISYICTQDIQSCSFEEY